MLLYSISEHFTISHYLIERRCNMRKNIVKLAKRLTQDVRITLGQIPMDEKRPEYTMLDTLLNDEQCEPMLHMKQRKPVTVRET